MQKCINLEIKKLKHNLVHVLIHSLAPPQQSSNSVRYELGENLKKLFDSDGDIKTITSRANLMSCRTKK